jgi:nucleoside-diphosphate-sugar epimerase
MKPASTDPEPPLRGRNILIVGKNSYVGEFLCQHLASKGARLTAVGSSDCNFLEADSVQHLFQTLGREPLTVLFLAVVNKDVRNSYLALLDNVKMAWNLVSSARGANVESLFYFSSVDVYGRSPELPMSETTSLDPDTWYGLSKSTCEWIVREELRSKCPTCILRIPGIFGRSRNDRSVIGRFVSSIRQEGKVYLHGDGKVLRDYVFAPDLCRVTERLISGKVSGTYNVATGASCSLLQILEKIRQTLEIDFEIVHLPANTERNFDMCFDPARLSAALGDFEFSPLSAAIRHYL